MEKQVHSKTEQEVQDKYNRTTVFLSRFIFSNNFDVLKKAGFVDSYTSDPEVMKILTLGENQRLLFLLFKNKKISTKNLRSVVISLAAIPTRIVFSYELVNDYCMIVIDFPEEFIKDYDYVTVGKYSKLSNEFKNKFPITRDVLNSQGQRIGREYSIYYHIFNKTEWLKNFWMERLGLIELDDALELWQAPDNKDLVFDVNSIIQT